MHGDNGIFRRNSIHPFGPQFDIGAFEFGYSWQPARTRASWAREFRATVGTDAVGVGAVGV
ncbi:MAG: hypothetical protein ACJAZN_001739, partial [Planctomycetota bacterium]